MKTSVYLSRKIERVALLVIMFFTSVLAIAQTTTTPDVNVTTTESTTTTTSEEWVSNPLYWVIGALVLIAIIAMVARGNRRA